MQPWQSVLLIIITLLVFGAGFYYDQIEKNTAIAYEESITSSPKQILVPIKNNSSFKNKEPKELQNSSAEYLNNKIRMLNDPYPNAYIKTADGKKLFIIESKLNSNEK